MAGVIFNWYCKMKENDRALRLIKKQATNNEIGLKSVEKRSLFSCLTIALASLTHSHIDWPRHIHSMRLFCKSDVALLKSVMQSALGGLQFSAASKQRNSIVFRLIEILHNALYLFSTNQSSTLRVRNIKICFAMLEHTQQNGDREQKCRANNSCVCALSIE